MPRQIRRIELYLPLTYNDGTPIEESKFVNVVDQLVDRFNGITATQRPFPLQGIWKSGGIVYQDRVMVYGMMDFSKRTDFETLRYLQTLKTRLKKQFEQLEVLITLQELTAI